MKKTLAVVVAAVLLAVMILPASVSAYSTPPEITAVNASEIGTWPMSAGSYDPALDGNGIKDGTHIYGCYDFDFTTYIITPKAVPTEIAGYEKVDSTADMTDGAWCVLTISGSPDYSYVLVMGEPGDFDSDSGDTTSPDTDETAPPDSTATPKPAASPPPVSSPAANFRTPSEITAVNASEIGTWPMSSGSYDPALDGQGIKSGTHIFGCYDFDFTTYIITPKAVPTSISGYTKVSTPAEMTDGTWCVLTIPGSPSYDYVLVMGEPDPNAVDTGSDSTGDTGGINPTVVIVIVVIVIVVAGVVLLNIAAKKKTERR